MRVLRVFLKGHNHMFIDAPLPDNVGMDQVMHNFKMDGYLMSGGTGNVPWAVPYDGWSLMAIVQLLDTQAVHTPHWVMPEQTKPN